MNAQLEHITAHETNSVLICLEILCVNVSVDMNYQMELVKVHTYTESCHPVAN